MNTNIPKPCTQDFSKMALRNDGRYCGECKKVVTDFTRMSDFEIIQYLRDNTKTCGIFHPHQMKEKLEVPELRNPSKSVFQKLFYGALLFGSSALAKAQDHHNDVNNNAQVASELIEDEVQSIDTFTYHINIPENTTSDTIESLMFVCGLDSIQLDASKHRLSISIPKLKVDSNLRIELKTQDSFYIFNIPETFTKSGQEFSVVYNDTWNLLFSPCSINWVLEPNPLFPPIVTGGVPPPNPFVIPVFDTFSITVTDLVDSLVLLNTSFQVDSAKTEIEKDTLIKKEEARKTIKKSLVYEKRSKNQWWWLVPVFLIVTIALIQVYRKKRKSIP